MNEFDELRALWQGQAAPRELDADTKAGIAAFHRKTQWQRRMLSIVMPLTIVYLLVMAVLFADLWYIIGIGVTIGAILFFLFAYRKYQRQFEPQPGPESTESFARHTLQQLRGWRSFARRNYPLYALFLVTGLSISMVGFLEKYSLADRLLIHGLYALGLGLFCAGVGWLTFRRQARRWGPLKQQLVDLLEEGVEKNEG